MKQVLVIKHETSSAQKISAALQQAGFFVVTLHNENEGLQIVTEQEWDLILIDWGTLNTPAPALCKQIRALKTTPIIVITSHLSSSDCVCTLRNGADDFIRKPFAPEELVARMKTILKRSLSNQIAPILHKLKFKDLLIDLSTKTVTQNGDLVLLTEREYDLLVFFMKNKNTLLNRESLLNHVWGYDVAVNPNVVDLYVGYLRKKINCHKNNRYIQTIHGRGYVMKQQQIIAPKSEN